MNLERTSDNSSAHSSGQPSNASEQPSIAHLQSLGISVKDFAFDSTLPAVRPYRRQPTQIQPSIRRPLVRQSTEPDEGLGSQPLSQATQHLERRITEPAPLPAPPARMPAYEDLNVQTTALEGGRVVQSDNGNVLNTPNNHSFSLNVSQARAIFSSSPLTPVPSSPFPPILQANTSCSSVVFDSRSPAIPRVLQPRYSFRKRPTPTNIATSKPSKRARINTSSESSNNSRTQVGLATNNKKSLTRHDSSPRKRVTSKRSSGNSEKGKRKRA
ncbi:hypothetical protein JR316_0004641 [Psilocybe cubensis]|uniref:Uncharacterized protein n=2 Tax=Psilocybe cubensis TaxID=181762 RepID=A0A8H8CLK0_PSICU|nr:hypothetical protein JR316_0004641 [Psilocybe cubensis]KAH9482541.1 hypothetical protein JR316_0004641 [Psilocybe cubensis]